VLPPVPAAELPLSSLHAGVGQEPYRAKQVVTRQCAKSIARGSSES
jgi:hypothetical protein